MTAGLGCIYLFRLQRERYRTQRPIAEYVQPEAVMTSVKKGAIMSGSIRNFTMHLTVPDLIAPNLEDCSIIDVGYFFRVSISLRITSCLLVILR